MSHDERFARRRRAVSDVTADALRPSSELYGQTAGPILRCRTCGHSFVEQPPAVEEYENTEDPVTIREERGRVATARRDLAEIERIVGPGRILDVGCWTGSFLLAARERGWEPVGIEPSKWATEQARSDGLDVRTTTLDAHGLERSSFSLIVLNDVIEHVTDPAASVQIIAGLLEPGGAVFMATPDAGSAVARLLGRRWWSVLPMHLQYFTRGSLSLLLQRHGFRIRWIKTHAKSFSARYYAERLGGYSSSIERVALRGLRTFGKLDRLVSPDFHDRMAVLATRVDA
ncbi:MAG: class I SAM-dependent methyltransferase [Actinobacteria bacterium]|nr:MAG: class I SAM-dependent methyltransferase [Actinomycetota bacterium]